MTTWSGSKTGTGTGTGTRIGHDQGQGQGQGLKIVSLHSEKIDFLLFLARKRNSQNL